MEHGRLNAAGPGSGQTEGSTHATVAKKFQLQQHNRRPIDSPAMMRSQTTTPSVRYWCSMDTRSVDTVAAAAEMVVLTAGEAGALKKSERRLGCMCSSRRWAPEGQCAAMPAAAGTSAPRIAQRSPAMAAEMDEKPTQGPRMALVEPGLKPAGGQGQVSVCMCQQVAPDSCALSV